MRNTSLRKRLYSIVRLVLLACFIFSSNAFAGNIVIFGDSQDSEIIQRKLVKAILTFKPAIVLRVGDSVDNGYDPREWELFNDINAQLLKTTEYFPALGNHEGGAYLYFVHFPFLKNKRWYSVDREGIHFIILDSNSELGLESGQYRWLESDLKNVSAGIKLKIVIFHHPLFDVGKEHLTDEKGLKPVLLPLFEKYNVNAVFSGHSHNYQRFIFKNIYFIVTGGGGSDLSDQAITHPYLKKFKKAYHFCVLTSRNDSVRIRVIDLNLNTIDEFAIPAAGPRVK